LRNRLSLFILRHSTTNLDRRRTNHGAFGLRHAGVGKFRISSVGWTHNLIEHGGAINDGDTFGIDELERFGGMPVLLAADLQ
jgi:hypothetical protein